MQDVARHAGVSVMTVSNVVNEHPHVRETTRERVLAAIDELGYRVNTTARSLRQGRTGVIGLALPEFDRPYFGMLSELYVARAAAHGYDVVLELTGSRREGEKAAIHHSRLRSYDGLLLHACALADEDVALLRGDLPVVVLGERSYTAPVDHGVMANEEGGALAGRHLVERGYRRPAMVGGRAWAPGDTDVATLRTKGFVAALLQAGLGLDPRQIRAAPYTLEAARAAVRGLLDEVPDVDGIFCATDYVALGVVRGLADLGRRVPHDVGVVGFDDVPLASYTAPSLTSVAPDHTAMTEAALSLLVERIAGTRPQHDYREVVGPVTLVARESTARPA
jgi:DNA-binding LacI/PurR family transcriptional regulator